MQGMSCLSKHAPGLVITSGQEQVTDLHELSVHPRPDLVELAHHSMLCHVDGNLCNEDLATLSQQVLIRQPVPAVVHLLHLSAPT